MEEVIHEVKGKRENNTCNKGSVSNVSKELLQIKKKMESSTIETYSKDTKY